MNKIAEKFGLLLKECKRTKEKKDKGEEKEADGVRSQGNRVGREKEKIDEKSSQTKEMERIGKDGWNRRGKQKKRCQGRGKKIKICLYSCNPTTMCWMWHKDNF